MTSEQDNNKLNSEIISEFRHKVIVDSFTLNLKNDIPICEINYSENLDEMLNKARQQQKEIDKRNFDTFVSCSTCREQFSCESAFNGNVLTCEYFPLQTEDIELAKEQGKKDGQLKRCDIEEHIKLGMVANYCGLCVSEFEKISKEAERTRIIEMIEKIENGNEIWSDMWVELKEQLKSEKPKTSAG